MRNASMVLIIAVAAGVAGCTSSGSSTTADTVESVSSSDPVEPRACPRQVATGPGVGFPEIKAQSKSDVSLYGLVFGGYPIPADESTKIVWRMTGNGKVQFVAVGPHGNQVRPQWGPEVHAGSSWARPGTEWGTGFVFPRRGCWTVTVTRGDAVATAHILVA